MNKQSAAPALERGLLILEHISDHPAGIGFNELCENLTLPPASVARFIKVLQSRHYIIKNSETGLHESGPACQKLAKHDNPREKLIQAATPILAALMNKTQNTALALYWNGFQLECVAKAIHEHSLAMQQIGDIRTDILNYPWSPFIFHNFSDKQKKQELGNSSKSRLKKQELTDHYTYFEQHGFCFYDDQHYRRLATPLFYKNKLCGAIGLGGFPYSLSDATIKKTGQLLIKLTKQLNLTLSLV